MAKKGISNQDVAIYKSEWTRNHHRYEQRQYKVFKDALDAQIKLVVEEIKKRGVSGLESLIPMLISREPLQLAYKTCYVSVGVANASWTYRKIKELAIGNTKSGVFKLFSEKWKRLMETFYETQSSQRIVDVTDTTIDKVQQALKESREQNLTLSQQADYLVAKLDDPDFNRNRALVIARTESTAGANMGATLGAADSDYLVNKQWLSIIDSVTRPSHVTANGQTVGVNEYFTVGDEQALYPGDLNLSAANCIQCRCTCLFVPIYDSNGLPVLKGQA